jgi:hypothetical protein
MQGINFRNTREKFSMIDINGSDAAMIEGDLMTSPIHDFVEKITAMAITYNYDEKDIEHILNVIDSINKEKK